VLSTVTIDVNAPAPVMSTEVGFRLPHVTGLVAPAGLVVTAHVRSTVPVNPLEGVTVIVEVPFAPCVTVIAPLSLKLKLGPALTVTFTVVLALTLPDTPVTENMYAPGVVLVVVVMVSNEFSGPAPVTFTETGATPQVGATMPGGGSTMLQESDTVPVKPLVGVTAMAEVFPVVAPGSTVMLPPLLSVKPGVVANVPPTINCSARVCSRPVESVAVIPMGNVPAPSAVVETTPKVNV